MRMQHLDTVRALAIGLVMFEHFAGQPLTDLFPIGAGSMGVGCFFTLSGFLITGILLQSLDAHPRQRGAVWLDFYARRFLRLVPAYYAVILALVLMDIPPTSIKWPWDITYLSNVDIALGGPDRVFWSLAVEEQFYLIWPAVIALVPRRALGMTILGMIGLALLFKLGVVLGGYSTRDVTRLLPGNLTLLGIGCLLARISYRGGTANCFTWYQGRTRTLFTMTAFGCLTLAVLIWRFLPAEGGLVRYFTNDLLCGTFYAWVVTNAAIGVQGRLKPLFDNGVLQYLGRISYGLYLVHNWMPAIVEKLFGPMPKYQAAPLVLALTLAVCMCSWHFFEKPILGLKRYFWNTRLKTPASARQSGNCDSPEPLTRPFDWDKKPVKSYS